MLDRWKMYQIRSQKSSKEAESHINRYGSEYFPITIEEHMELLRGRRIPDSRINLDVMGVNERA